MLLYAPTSALLSVGLLICILLFSTGSTFQHYQNIQLHKPLIGGATTVAQLRAQLANQVLLTIAYCPTEETAEGAVVSVDPTSNKFKILGTFSWGKAVFGCAALNDPTITLDPTTMTLFLNFGDDLGMQLALNLLKTRIEHAVTPSDEFFVGFTNMAYYKKSIFDEVTLGVSPTGKDDGEFNFGSLNVKTGKYVNAKQTIPFKAMMDDSHYFDATNNTFYVQASYDQRQVKCAPADTDLCLLAIDATTGELKSSIFTNWTVYKYAKDLDKNGNILAFVNGFDQLCEDPYNEFLFATVNLFQATAHPIACIPKNAIIQEAEWISSFSPDERYLATGSRFDGETQFLVFSTATGKIVLNSRLNGLAEQLNTADKLYWIWGIDYVY